MRIAIVDDEPTLLMLIGSTLKAYSQERSIDIKTSEFITGDMFLENYETGRYDLIFMDVYMPGMDGIETVLKLREMDPSVAVVFLTASEDHMKKALSCHAFDYLVKPAEPAEVYRVMDECIKMLGKSSLADSKYLEVISDRMSVKISQAKLVSVSVRGHAIYVCDDEQNVYMAKQSFSSLEEKIGDWENILLLNRGVLVNMDYIATFEDGVCVMKDGYHFQAKVRTAKQLQQKWLDYKVQTGNK